jgi:hypothetical protein
MGDCWCGSVWRNQLGFVIVTTESEPTNCPAVKNDIWNCKMDKTENPFSVSKAKKFCDFCRNVPLGVGKIIGENLLLQKI